MRAAEKFSDADADFVTGDGGGQQIASGASPRLSDGERRWKHDGAWMKHRAIVNIVLFGEMRRRGVDHRGKERRGPPTRDEHFGRAIGRPHLQRKAFDRLDRPRVFSGERRADPIEQQILRPLHDGGGNIVEAQVAREPGEGRTRVYVDLRHQTTFSARNRSISASV